MSSGTNHQNTKMSDVPLYSSRLIKNYIEYLNEHNPEVDIEFLINYAGITSYELEDGGHWFTQTQIDRFHEVMDRQTKDPNIARNVGRYSTLSRAAIPIRQYILGFMTPAIAYSVLGKLYPTVSRACTIHTKQMGSNTVEVMFLPNPGVEEKPFQCENRLGTLEAMAKYFATKFASIEHPSCMHKGDKSCRYIISWEKTSSLIWKRL
ncbi:MAG: hypothetical protein H6R39_23, partial [Deltaproteobacteria bacterium]|nr:hypothetical protein [Deltaproteobacteria bacterium]